MAEQKVAGKRYPLFRSTGGMTPVFEMVACAKDITINRTRNVTEDETKCGIEREVEDISGESFTGAFSMIIDPDTGRVGQEILEADFANNVESVWVIQDAASPTPGTPTWTLTGKITEFNTDLPVQGRATQNLTIVPTNGVNITFEIAS